MARLTYQGPEGHQYAFTAETGARFTAYVKDSLQSYLPPVGGALEAEVEQKTSKQGSQYTQIVAINGQRATRGGGGGFGKGGGGRGYDNKAFVSNVVGQAIAAGLIKKPEDIDPWATHAFEVIGRIGPATALAGVNDNAQAAPPAPPSNPIPPGGDAIPF